MNTDPLTQNDLSSPQTEPLGYIPRSGGSMLCLEMNFIVAYMVLISLALATSESPLSSAEPSEVELKYQQLVPNKPIEPKKMRETMMLLHRKDLLVSSSSPFVLTEIGRRTALKCLQLSRLQYPLIETFLEEGGSRHLTPTVSTVSTVSPSSTSSPLVLPPLSWPLPPPPAGQLMGEPSASTDRLSPFVPSSPRPAITPVAVGGSESEWEVVLVLDSREVRSQQDRGFLANQLHIAGVRCEVRSLGLGDVQWMLRHREKGSEAMLDVLVERKNVRDLAQSILDGRFREQQYRLGRCGARHPVYLVEGGLATQDVLPTDSLLTGMMRTVMNQDIYVYQSTSIDDSIVFLRSLHEIEKAAVHRYFEKGDE